MIGLFVLAGLHSVLVPLAMALLRECGKTDVAKIAGGIISDEDSEKLMELGVVDVLQTSASPSLFVPFRFTKETSLLEKD